MILEKLRVSIGTAAVMGLIRCRLDVKPTTAYLMTYTEGSCTANCSFCSQARESPSRKSLLSRVIWPAFPPGRVLEGLRRARRGRNSKTKHDQITAHNEAIVAEGSCPTCRRAGGLLYKEKAVRV